MREEYLWDRSGEADPFVQEMESLLGHFDRRPRPAAILCDDHEATVAPASRRTDAPGPRAPASRRAFWFAAVAAAAVIALVVWRPQSDDASRSVAPSQADRARTTQRPELGEEAVIAPHPGGGVTPTAQGRERDVAARPARARAGRDARTRSRRSSSGEGRPRVAAVSSDETQSEVSQRIANAIEAYAPQIKACLEAGHKAHPERQGYLWLTFSVLPDGRTTNVATSPRGKTRAPDVTRCLVDAAQTWRFAADDRIPPEGTPVRIPVFLQKPTPD